MPDYWQGFAHGSVVGLCVGVFIMCLCVAAREK